MSVIPLTVSCALSQKASNAISPFSSPAIPVLVGSGSYALFTRGRHFPLVGFAAYRSLDHQLAKDPSLSTFQKIINGFMSGSLGGFSESVVTYHINKLRSRQPKFLDSRAPVAILIWGAAGCLASLQNCFMPK